MTDYNQIAGGITGFTQGLNQGINTGIRIGNYRDRRQHELERKEQQAKQERQTAFINEASFVPIAVPALFGSDSEVGPVDPGVILEKAHSMGVFTDVERLEPDLETGTLRMFKKGQKEPVELSKDQLSARINFYNKSLTGLAEMMKRSTGAQTALPDPSKGQVGMAYNKLGTVLDLSQVDARTRGQVEQAMVDGASVDQIAQGFGIPYLARPSSDVLSSTRETPSLGAKAIDFVQGRAPVGSPIHGIIGRMTGKVVADATRGLGRTDGSDGLLLQKVKRMKAIDLSGQYPGGRPSAVSQAIPAEQVKDKEPVKTGAKKSAKTSVKKLKVNPYNPSTEGLGVNEIVKLVMEQNPGASEEEVIAALIEDGTLMEK